MLLPISFNAGQIQRIKNIKYVLLLLILSLVPISTASAHKVKISTDVGATLHMEPNDNPRAGEPVQAWFALTHKGGKVISLAECNCRLAVHAEPHPKDDPALLEPSLKSVQAEKYQGIPGAEIIFPKPGEYELQLSGTAVKAGSFQPFTLGFKVIVTSGKAITQPPVYQQ